jgi:hypothetical protein
VGSANAGADPGIPGTNPRVSGTTNSNSKVHEVPEQPVQALQG